MLSNVRNLILDMDGVLWRGNTPMPGLADFFGTLNKLNINFVLATNNATKTAAQYTAKLAGFGLTIPNAQILTSAETTAVYLSQHYAAGTAVYLIGDVGLHEAIKNQGFRIIKREDALEETAVSLVVAGFWPDVHYQDLAVGSLLIQRGATFIGTNPDPTFPSEIGPLPGAGSLLAFLTAASGVQPKIIGKPNKIVFLEALKRLDGSKTDTAMVGDRLSTDVLGAKNAGLRSILVLSGISTREDVAQSDFKPDFILENIQELATQLQQQV